MAFSSAALTEFMTDIKDWQTLIAGGMALLGAIMTVLVINCQIRQQKKKWEDDLKRKVRSLRAGLTIPLMEISDYCGRIISIAVEELDKVEALNFNESDINDDANYKILDATHRTNFSQRRNAKTASEFKQSY